MEQIRLLHECLEDAIGSAVQSLGGRKKVASLLWPALKPEIGYARISSCLSQDKADKFSLDELVRIARLARDVGDHSFMQYLAGELSYRIEPISPKDELAQALESFDEKADQILSAIAAVKRAQMRKAS
jgi:hypothetical protein